MLSSYDSERVHSETPEDGITPLYAAEFILIGEFAYGVAVRIYHSQI